VICRTLGVLCILFCATLLPPIGVSLLYADGESGRFAAAGSIALLAGLLFGCRFAASTSTCAVGTGS
jgi:trk system potassium uptake protein TrkH